MSEDNKVSGKSRLLPMINCRESPAIFRVESKPRRANENAIRSRRSPSQFLQGTLTSEDSTKKREGAISLSPLQTNKKAMQKHYKHASTSHCANCLMKDKVYFLIYSQFTEQS